MDFFSHENRGFGCFWALFIKKFIFNIKFWVFWGSFHFSLFVNKIELCLTGYITSKNKGGGGETPYGRFPKLIRFFCLMASLTLGRVSALQ